MKSDVSENAGQVCIRCGAANEPGASRCEECGSPMDDFASSAPWEMGTAGGKAYHAVDPVRKPIIFWGVLLYFVPTGLLMLWETKVIIQAMRGNEVPVTYFGMTGALALVLPLLYSLVSIWIVCSVTKRFLRKTRDGN